MPPPLLHISDLSDPRLAPYAGMRDAELAQRAFPHDPAGHGGLGGLFIAEGELVVRRLIDSAFATDSLLLAENRVSALADALDRLPPPTPVFVAPQSLLNSIVGFNMHRGILAIGRRAEPASLEALLNLPGPLLVLEDLVNHDNLGAIFRNAAGLGGAGCGILLSPRCADPLYRKSLRVSMGHVLGVPFARLREWPEDLARIRAAGWTLAALTPHPAAKSLATMPHGPRLAFLLGSEGPGLSPAAADAVDHAIRIDMPPGPTGVRIDSLNVAMAAGIVLHRIVGAGEPRALHPPDSRTNT